MSGDKKEIGLAVVGCGTIGRIRAEFARRLSETSPAVAVFEAALLVETGAWRDFDRLVVVSCSRDQQIARLERRDGLSTEAAEARLAAQLEQRHAARGGPHRRQRRPGARPALRG